MTVSFFRRHRTLFMVLMALGVLGFVFFGAWQSMREKWFAWFGTRQMRETAAKMFGEDVSRGDLSQFYQKLRNAGMASQDLGQYLYQKAAPSGDEGRLGAISEYTIGMSAWPYVSEDFPKEGPELKALTAWYAMYEKARRMGFEVGEVAVQSRMGQLLDLVGDDPEARVFMTRVVREYAGGEMPQLADAFEVDMTLRAYLDWVVSALTVPVEPELRREYIDEGEQIKVRLAVLSADGFLDQVGAPTEEQLQKQFEQYKDVLPRESPSGFGYRIPDQVAIEYLVAEPKAFEAEAGAAVTDDDIRKFYDAHKDELYKVEPPAPAAEEEKAGEEKAGEEKAGEEKAAEAPEYKPLDEVREDVRSRLVTAKAQEQAAMLLNRDVAEVRAMKTAQDLAYWADGVKVRLVKVEKLMTGDELATLEGIGTARNRDSSVPDVALALPQLVPAAEAKIGLNEISEVFTGEEGRAYAFRVTRFRENHPAPDIDAVRAEVVRDVKALQAYDKAYGAARKLLEAAAGEGLEAAGKAAGVEVTVTDFFPREHVAWYMMRAIRFPPTLPGVGASPALIAKLFALKKGHNERLLEGLPDQRKVVVAELADRRPPDEPGYRARRARLAIQVSRSLAGSAVRTELQPDQILARLGVKLVEKKAESQEGAETPEPGAGGQ